MRALILNAPEEYLTRLGELPAGVRAELQADGKYDFVQIFVRSRQEFERLYPAAQAAIQYDGILWISYPKKSGAIASDLSRDILWDLTRGSGLRPVTQIALDETWSALRYRPDEKVGS
jgi:hypothetical protein